MMRIPFDARYWVRTPSFVLVSVVMTFALNDVYAAGTPEERAAAQVLFDQAKVLAQSQKFAEACPKFAESQRLDPRISTQFKLADCYEQLGLTASAWTNFVDVVNQTKTAKQKDRQVVAQKRADALETKLSRVTLEVPAASRVVGMEVKRNGTLLGEAMWGTALPVDPGEQTFVVTAPGKKDWQVTITVKKGKRDTSVQVPVLEAAPRDVVVNATGEKGLSGDATKPKEADVSPPIVRGTALRTAGFTVGALGIGLLGVGSFFGVTAKEKNEESLGFCRTSQYCSENGLALNDEAKSAAAISTATFIGGGVLLTAGVVMILAAPSSPTGVRKNVVAFVPVLGSSLAGGVLTGVW